MLKITYADLLKLVLDTSPQKHSLVSGEREHPGVTSMALFFAKDDSGVLPTLTSSLSYQPPSPMSTYGKLSMGPRVLGEIK